MKAAALSTGLLLLGLTLSGCVSDMIAAERQRGSGTHRLISGKPDDVREAFHLYIQKSNATTTSIPPFTLTDEAGMTEAVNLNHVAMATIIIRYKLFYAPGPKPGQTDAELVAELPRGMDTPQYLQKHENEMLDGIAKAVAQLRANRGETDEPAASEGQAPAQAAPWWK